MQIDKKMTAIAAVAAGEESRFGRMDHVRLVQDADGSGKIQATNGVVAVEIATQGDPDAGPFDVLVEPSTLKAVSTSIKAATPARAFVPGDVDPDAPENAALRIIAGSATYDIDPRGKEVFPSFEDIMRAPERDDAPFEVELNLTKITALLTVLSRICAKASRHDDDKRVIFKITKRCIYMSCDNTRAVILCCL